MNDWLAVLGFKTTTLLGGLIGALFSLKFAPGSGTGQKAINVIGGMFTATYVAPLLRQEFGLPSSFEAGVGFLIGLCGMAVLAAFMQQVPIAVVALRKRFIGGE